MKGKVACIGGAAVDRKYRGRAPIVLGSSNPVSSASCFGGVARNIAENLSRLGVSSSLISVLGDDENGRSILHHLNELGVDTRHCIISADHKTAEYVAVLEPDGGLLTGLADMAIFDVFTPDLLTSRRLEIASCDWIFADCNLPEATLVTLMASARRGSIPLAVDAVSSAKVHRLPQDLKGIELLFLNRDEADVLREHSALPLAP